MVSWTEGALRFVDLDDAHRRRTRAALLDLAVASSLLDGMQRTAYDYPTLVLKDATPITSRKASFEI
jgi:hypothetical protein